MNNTHDQASECWYPVPEFVGLYEISNLSRVRTIKTGHIKKQQQLNGYFYVDLWRNGLKCARFVHRLLLQALTGVMDEELEVNHKDGDHGNNAPNNLEWVTSSGNKLHSVHVLGHVRPIFVKGAENYNNRPVEAVDEHGIVVLRFASIELTSTDGFKPASVAHAIKGVRQQRHRGLQWRYALEQTTYRAGQGAL